MALTILKPFRFAKRGFLPGQESALAEAKPSDEQIEEWAKRGLVAPDGDSALAQDLQADAETKEVLQLLADNAGEDDKTPLESLQRITGERDALRFGVDELARDTPPFDGQVAGESEDSLLFIVRQLAFLVREYDRSQNSEAVSSVVASAPTTPSDEMATPVTAQEITELLKSAKAALALMGAGFDTREKIRAASDAELEALDDVGKASVEKLRAAFVV